MKKPDVVHHTRAARKGSENSRATSADSLTMRVSCELVDQTFSLVQVILKYRHMVSTRAATIYAFYGKVNDSREEEKHLSLFKSGQLQTQSKDSLYTNIKFATWLFRIHYNSTIIKKTNNFGWTNRN